MATAETAELVARLSLRDEISGKITGIQRKVSGLDASFSRTQKSLDKAGQNLSRIGLIAGGAVVGGLVGAAKAAGDFEASLNTINTIARANAQDLGKIGDTVRKIARDTGTPLSELTQGYYDLLSAGIKTADAQNVLTAANKLAIGGLASTAETVDLLTTAINTYGGDATKAAAYADIFAKAVERGKVTAAEIAQSFAQVGPIAAASGIEIEELSAAYARLTSAGVPAAEASTQVRSAIVALTRTSSDLEKLQKQTGKNYLSIAGKQGLVEALQQLRTDGEKAGVPLIDLLGRVEGLNFTLATTGTNFAAYNADLAAMGDASGTAAEQMAERQKGLNFQLARLKALALDAGITIGSALLPKLTPLVAKLNDFISNNQGRIAEFGDKLSKAFTDVGNAVGKIDWTGIAGGLELTGRVAKTIVDAFMALPPGLQSLAIAALAVNKVGGGIVTSGLKDLAGLALKSLTTIHAANVTVIGGNVAGGGIPGAGGAKGGALAILGGLVGLAAVAAIEVEIAKPLGEWARSQPWWDTDAGPVHIGGPSQSQQAHEGTGNGGLVYGGNRRDGETGGPSLAERDERAAAVAAAVFARTFGTHTAAASSFGGGELREFRTTITGAIDLFGDRVKYLSSAQGAGSGSEKYQSLIQRDIAALKTLLPRASAADAATIKGEIAILEGILATKKFEPSAALIEAVASKNDKTYQGLEDNRAATNAVASRVDTTNQHLEDVRSTTRTGLSATAYASQQAAAAIRDKNFSPRITVNTTVNTSVSVRDQQLRAKSASSYGFMIGGK